MNTSNAAQDHMRPEHVQAEINRGKAIALRIDGRTFREIAALLQVSVSVAHKYVVKGLEELRNDNAEATEAVRRVEIARLDRWTAILTERLATGADDGKPPPGWYDPEKTVRALLRVAERRARLLGLDAPVKWEGSGPDGGPLLPPGAIHITLVAASDVVHGTATISGMATISPPEEPESA